VVGALANGLAAILCWYCGCGINSVVGSGIDRLATGMTGEGVETADNEELADMFSSVDVSSIRSSINSSDSPVETFIEKPDSASELILLLFPASFQPLAEELGVEE